MKLHTNITLYELRHGGMKSSGTENVTDTVYGHYDPFELMALLRGYIQAGYQIDVTVTGRKDKRSKQARLYFPLNYCPDCEVMHDQT